MALLSTKFKLKPQLTGADIKSLYEAQPDTNAFTDTDKTKLIGIEAEAQVTWIITSVKTSNYIAANNERIPCNTSGGPFTITLPNSGRVSVFDIAGTTPVTGFGVNSLTINPNSGQTVMGDNTLEVDIGASSVELYLVGTDWRIVDGITSADNASLDVVPGSLLTDGSVSSNKLDASVNASLGLAHTALQPDQVETVSGDYTFNGALILPNNSRINNIEHFYQTTKPTTRGDSSALVAGDRWWKTDDGTEWFWNGTYWLGALLEKTSALAVNTTAAVTDLIGLSSQYNILAAELRVGFHRITDPPTINDYWNLTYTFHPIQPDNLSVSTTVRLNDTSTSTGTTRGCLTVIPLGIFVKTTGSDINSMQKLYAIYSPVGSPPTLRSPFFSLFYHLIAP